MTDNMAYGAEIGKKRDEDSDDREFPSISTFTRVFLFLAFALSFMF
jgi:hypothetical protein